jgi:FtsH-binding integral membrane protein
MAELHPPTLASPPATSAVVAESRSYAEWGAVFAGAIGALALSFLLLTFGSAVGLSIISPWSQAGASSTTLGIMTGLWFMVVEIASFAAGGYLAGRMRSKRGDAVAEEGEFRDGAHGFLAWALAVVLGAILASTTAASVAKSGIEAGGNVVASTIGAAGAAATQATASLPTEYYVDMLFRMNDPSSGQQADRLAEVGRILASGIAKGEVSTDDRAYLTKVVVAQTGLSPQEAEKRVNEVLTQARNAATALADKAREAANKARKVAAVAGFITAATLLVSALVAWWAAGVGGRHRETNTIPAALFRSSLRSSP